MAQQQQPQQQTSSFAYSDDYIEIHCSICQYPGVDVCFSGCSCQVHAVRVECWRVGKKRTRNLFGLYTIANRVLCLPQTSVTNWEAKTMRYCEP